MPRDWKRSVCPSSLLLALILRRGRGTTAFELKSAYRSEYEVSVVCTVIVHRTGDSVQCICSDAAIRFLCADGRSHRHCSKSRIRCYAIVVPHSTFFCAIHGWLSFFLNTIEHRDFRV